MSSVSIINQFDPSGLEDSGVTSLKEGVDTRYPHNLCIVRNNDGSFHELVSIPTHNQFNIRDTLVVNDISHIVARILIEDPIIRHEVMHLSTQDIIQLSNASEDELSQWAQEHKMVITKVDYTAGAVFRTDSYTLFMCDVPPEHRERIEGKMQQVLPLTPEEIQNYTKGAWWQAIDRNGEYETLCYRALRTLKENPKFDLDELAKILNYSGIKLNLDTFPRYTLETLGEAEISALVPAVIQNKIAQALPYDQLIKRMSEQLHRFSADDQSIIQVYTKCTRSHVGENKLRSLWMQHILSVYAKEMNIEDRIVLLGIGESFGLLIFTKTLNHLFLHTAGSNAMLARPAGGVSHRNRFASALDRVSATFLPGINPPEYIHGVHSAGWAEDTAHDLVHQITETSTPSREPWIHLANYLLEKTGNEDVYNVLLDRAFNRESGTFLDTWHNNIPRNFKVNFLEESVVTELLQMCELHLKTWLEEYSDLFFSR